MATGTDDHQDAYGGTAGRVRQVPVPPAARARSTLSRVDYDDAFVVETSPPRNRTGEQWARAMLEDAPMSTRRALSMAWLALGLRLGSTRSDRFVLGWHLRRVTEDFALLGARGRLGLSGELLFATEQGRLVFATFVQLDNPVARAAWAAIARRHRRVVRQLLEQASLAPSK